MVARPERAMNWLTLKDEAVVAFRMRNVLRRHKPSSDTAHDQDHHRVVWGSLTGRVPVPRIARWR